MNGDVEGDSSSQRYQQQRLERAQATLAEWPDAPGAIAALRDWMMTCGLVVEGGLGWAAFRRLPHDAQPSAALAVAGYGAAANAVDSAVEDHLHESPAGRLLFGLAAAEAAIAGTDPSALQKLVVFASQDPVTAFVFGNRFRDEASGRPELIAALRAAAQQVVEHFNRDPSSFFMGRQFDGLAERIYKDGNGARVEDLWSDPFGGEIFLFGRGYLFDLLRNLDARGYLDLLELFNHPAPVRACLALIHNPDTLLNLLPQATVAFKGTDWTGAMVRPLLVLAFFRLLAERRITNQVGRGGSNLEINMAPGRLAETLLRPDVSEVMLTLRFQAYLIKQFGLRFRENSGREPEPQDGPRFVEWKFINALASALQASGKENELSLEVPENEWLYGLVAVALSRDAQTSTTDELVDALERAACSLEAVATFASGGLLPEHWPMTQLAGVLCRASDPVERWKRMWRLTASLRDSAAHRRAHSTHELLYIAPFLLSLGLRACDYLYESPVVARRLWTEVHQATLETYLVERLLRERLNDIVVRVVVRALSIPEEQSNGIATASSQLSRAIAPYLAPDALAVHIFLSLEINGVEPAIMAQATAEAGRDLASLCAEIEDLVDLGAIRTVSASNLAALHRLGAEAGRS